jgi:uncharacterized membrane protein YozB (DUF420 family)
MTVYVVLMLFWLVWGGYNYDPQHPRAVGGTLIPWAAVAILGYVIFGGAR